MIPSRHDVITANNNNNSAHLLIWLSAQFFFSVCKACANKMLTHTHTCSCKNHTEVVLQMAAERCVMHLQLMVARSIKLFGYFKKMTEEARRQPRAVPRLQHCVYLESYSCGEGKEQQSSNRATESLFLVLFAVGSFETPSLSPRQE